MLHLQTKNDPLPPLVRQAFDGVKVCWNAGEAAELLPRLHPIPDVDLPENELHRRPCLSRRPLLL
jgi:hypothetical protein